VEIPDDHPRKASLELRHRVIDGLKMGITAPAGLIAHGRGEAFDYLLGEKTHEMALLACKAGAGALKTAKHPVVSVNGNVAALCPGQVVGLANAVKACLEVNLFYRSRERLGKIRDVLVEHGADRVYGVDVDKNTVAGLSSERAKADEAILGADWVLVMLEDGDRTEKLKEMGKKVVAVDLNPLSRTAQKADISIVDNVVRALPVMTDYASSVDDLECSKALEAFDNEANLAVMEKAIRANL